MKKYKEYKDSGIEWLGEIPSHWNIKRIKNISDVKVGGTPSRDKEEYWLNGDIPWIPSGKLKDKRIDICDIEEYITKKGFDNSSTYVIDKNSVMVALTGATLGKIGYNTFETTTNQSVASIISHDVSDYKYIYYLLLSQYQQIDSMRQGGAQSGINKEDVKNIKLTFPPLQEQQQIASYLDYKTSKIDELISKKEELVETLKNARQKLISETITKGLDKDVKMKNSGVEWIGEIPEHWEIKELKYLLSENITDGPHETPEFLDEGISFLSVDGIINGELNFKNCRKISLESHNRYSKKCKPEYNNILFGKSASVGKVARVKTTQEFSVWSPLALIKLDESSVEPGFIEYFLKSDTIKRNIMFYSTFNTQQNISMDKIKRFKIIVPPLKEQLEVLNFLELRCLKIDELISKTEKQMEILKKAKQSLITEVVTGKIDVRGWTK